MYFKLKGGNYNMSNKEKLKFQLGTYFKNYSYIILLMIMYGFTDGMGNMTISQTLNFNITNYYNQGNQVVLNTMIVFLLLSVGFERIYNETTIYFFNIGFTRKRYYFGNIIVVIITSLLTSLVCCITFFILLESDIGSNHYKFIQCFGCKFISINAGTVIQITVLITAIYSVIYMLANLVGILYMILMIKGKRIIPIIITIILGVSGGWIVYYPTTVNYVFEKFIYINNSYALYIIVLIALSFLEYILGKNLFMKIDLKNR